MRVATWNVNSLKARLGRVEEWLGYAQPDVLCMQETKVSDKDFPAMAFGALGYEAVHHGEGRWNGVAIVSRVGITDVTPGLPGDEEDREARALTAVCDGVRITSVYVPNGRVVGSDHFAYKLAWLDRLCAHAEPTTDALICGDFNVAHTDLDVWNARQAHGGTHVTPEERSKVDAIIARGFVDVFRVLYQEPQLFTWWDYRAGDFHKHKGMRLDLVLASKDLADRATFALIDRFARKGKLPSDHAPLLVDFER
jgi:exodeoxyribonuclease III